MTVCRRVVEGLVCGWHWSLPLQPVVALPGSQALAVLELMGSPSAVPPLSGAGLLFELSGSVAAQRSLHLTPLCGADWP